MILCPKCNNKLDRSSEYSFICADCGLDISSADGQMIFHPEFSNHHDGMDSSILDDFLAEEERYFWMRARKSLIKSVFERYVSLSDRIIEIGAGTGNVTKFLMKNGYNNISVGEIHVKGLEYAKSYGIKERYQFDLTRAPFAEHFDVVAMFDVLEHINEDVVAVKNVYKMLAFGGKAIVTVPAHMWLWNKEDIIVSHRKRYERDELKKLFEENGFEVLWSTAFFVSILPLLLLRRLLKKETGIIKTSDSRDRFKINPVTNYVLEKVLSIENRLIMGHSLKWGGSIILVAEKNQAKYIAEDGQ